MTIYFLVKFYDNREHADAFVSGSVFVNGLSKYKRGREADGSGRIGADEGTFLWGQPGRGKLSINGMDISDSVVAPIRVQKSWVDHLHVFCMHAAHSDVSPASMSKDNVAALRRALVMSDKCLALGGHAVVVMNLPEFVRRIRSSATSQGFGIEGRLVKYYDPATFHGQFGDVESVFRKQIQYSHQREYRFVIQSGSLGDSPLILDVGDLSDVTMRFDAEELRGEEWLQGLAVQETD